VGSRAVEGCPNVDVAMKWRHLCRGGGRAKCSGRHFDQTVTSVVNKCLEKTLGPVISSIVIFDASQFAYPYVVRGIKWRVMSWECVLRVLLGSHKCAPPGRLCVGARILRKLIFKQTGWSGVDWVVELRGGIQWRAVVNKVMDISVE